MTKQENTKHSVKTVVRIFFYSILLYTKTFTKHSKKEIVSKKALFNKSNPRRRMAIDPGKELNLFLRKSIVTACLCFNKHFLLI